MAEGEETQSHTRTSSGFWPQQDEVTCRVSVGAGACAWQGRGHNRLLCVLQAAGGTRSLAYSSLPVPNPAQERIHRMLGIPGEARRGLGSRLGNCHRLERATDASLLTAGCPPPTPPSISAEPFGEGMYGTTLAQILVPAADSNHGNHSFLCLSLSPPPSPAVLNYQIDQKYDAHNDHCMDGYLGNQVGGLLEVE